MSLNKSGLTYKIFKSTMQMITGSAVLTICTFISGYFYARYLGPDVYGIWQTAQVFIGYAFFFSLGLPFVMRRDFVQLKSEGKIEDATKLAHLVLTYIYYVTPVATLLVWGYAFFFVENTMFKYSLFVVGIIYILSVVSSFGNIMSKALNRYHDVTWQNTIFGLGMVAVIPFVYFWGYYTLLIGIIITNIIISLYYFKNRQITFGYYWNTKLFKQMVITSFPLFLTGVIGLVFGSIDRILIASVIDFKNVGLYSLSNFISNPITLVITSTSLVLFTHLNERYGKSKETHVILKQVDIPQSFFSWALPPLIGMGIIALPVFVGKFLPKYTEGIFAAQVNVFALFFYKMAGFSSNALFILDKQKFSALSFFISGIIKVIGILILVNLGLGIVGVAISNVFAYYFYDSLMLWQVYRQIKFSNKQWLLSSFKKIQIAVAVLLFCLLFNYFNNNYLIGYEWIKLIIGEAIIILLSLPVFIYLYKNYKSFFVKKKIN